MAGHNEDMEWLTEFLRNRHVHETIIAKFIEEKMDAEAICAADDKTMREIGIDTRGDIVALRLFCKRKLNSNTTQTKSEEREKKKLQLLSYLSSGGGEGPSRRANKKAAIKAKATEVNKMKRLELGWLHQPYGGEHCVNVRAKDGGGVRIITMPGNSKKSDIIAYGKKLFFSNGSSCFGSEFDLLFQLGNYKQDIVQATVTFPDGTAHPFTLQNYSKSTKLSKTRLYIITKKLEDSDDEGLLQCLHAAGMAHPPLSPPSGVQVSNPIVEVPMARAQPPLSPPSGVPVSTPIVELPTSREQPRLSPPKGLQVSTPAMEVPISRPPCPLSPLRGIQVSISTMEVPMSSGRPEIVDLDDWQEELFWSGNEPREVNSRSPVHCQQTICEALNTGEVPSNFVLHEENEFETPISRPIRDIRPPRRFTPSDYDLQNETTSLQLERPNNDERNVSKANQSTGQPEVRAKRFLKIKRLNIKIDLIQAFSDPTIVEDEVVISVINQKGENEKGSGSGVYRDVLSTFWSDVYESLMVGEEERVPCIRHDYQRQEWEAVARILVYGYQNYQYFPILLCKTFFAQCLFGEDAVSRAMLIASFRRYVSESERELIDKCLNSEVEENDEEVLEFFTNFDCKVLLKKSTLAQVLEEVAHKELIQKPQYVTECWKDIVLELKSYFSSPAVIDELWERST